MQQQMIMMQQAQAQMAGSGGVMQGKVLMMN
jgi:hypothetical protein